MRSLILSVAAVVVLLTAAAPGAFATDPTATPAPTGPYDGQIVVDPTFVSGGVLPTQAPGQPDAPGHPLVTPPATDAISTDAGAGSSPAVPVLILAASAVAALVVAPRPASRRSTRRA